MNRFATSWVGFVCGSMVWFGSQGLLASEEVKLHTGWQVRSSAGSPAGDVISRSNFKPAGWYSGEVPSTIGAVILNSGSSKDPFFGMNLREFPGTNYPISKDFYHLQMPDDSPFKVSWWYRTEFQSPTRKVGGHVWLNFAGINYAANIWLNGTLIAGKDVVVGTFRQFQFDVTPYLVAKTPNVLAVEIFAPKPDSLAPTWVDWNPAPGDKNMGLWRDVAIQSTGAIRIKHAFVTSKIQWPGAHQARLALTLDMVNSENRPLDVNLVGDVGGVPLSKTVQFLPNEQKRIVTHLDMPSPKLWWPYQMGKQNMYKATVKVVVAGQSSDQRDFSFGVREVTSEYLSNGARLFKINGQKFFVRGGGWAPDMFLRSSDLRDEQEYNYVKDLNLNTIRFEGKFETEHFLDLADRKGVMMMPGWACCTRWEDGKHWGAKDFEIAEASLRDQIYHHINHPSTLVWLYGSDIAPPAAVEKVYLKVLTEEGWPNPFISAATQDNTLGGPTGVKMTGPYDYVPPSYWLTDTTHGGAFGFNTETSVGPAVPPVESLKKMLPQDHWWPIDYVWNYHAGVEHFQHIKYFTEAMGRRYGGANSIDEYAMKAQVLAYDGHRAMFEAYNSRKYQTTTGIIQWMLNNAWPSLIWHLYDYYLRPGGSYFGAKKALEAIHIQYSYDDNSIVVVNNSYEAHNQLTAEVQLLDFDLKQLVGQKVQIDVQPDSAVKVMKLPDVKGLTTTYFVRLNLVDRAGQVVSQNFYWLSTQKEILNWVLTDFTHTPTIRDGDLRLLTTLPQVQVTGTATLSSGHVSVTLQNLGSHIAFFTRLKLNQADGSEILPVIWEDNYITLMPGEKRTIQASYSKSVTGASLDVSGWNVKAVRLHRH